MNFIDAIVEKDLKNGKNQGRVCTRVPPEPNGYLHIGHGKSICLNFGIALRHQGACNLYFDDTNPGKEKEEYVKAIGEDIRWLGFEWDKLYYASDHYEKLFHIACRLIENGKAYVCQLNADEIKDYRGTLTEPGRNSPYRERGIAESLNLFHRMRAGAFPDGFCTLRAKIDMAAPVICMRDPVLYRIMRVTHYRTGGQWLIYPMYDFASPLVDALEGVTHSLCGIEFEDHRPLYEWVVREAGCFLNPPQQIEFAKLKLTRTLLGKRFLRQVVEQGIVNGWDDPRMPTIAGMRRRGYPPAAIRSFMELIGVAKADSLVDFSLLEHCVREELESVERRMVVLKPIRLTIENYPEEKIEYAQLENHPARSERGVREVPFTRDLYIERDDFTEVPPANYHRLYPGAEVRLKGAYIVKCTGVTYGINGEMAARCEYDPGKKIGVDPRKVKGTLHWVSARFAVPVEIRQFDFLLKENIPDPDRWQEQLNPDSLEVVKGFAEPELDKATVGDCFQFLRQGYYCVDTDSTPAKIVFNRIVGLKEASKK